MYLNCHSYHSLRYGIIPVDELVAMAKENNVKALALTDINATTGVYDFILACQEHDIKPLVGIEFRRDHKLLYIALVKNARGFGEMCRLLSHHNLEDIPLADSPPAFNDVIVIYPLENAPLILRENEYIGIRPEQLTRLIVAQWKHRINRMVILQSVTFRVKREFNLHRILRAVDLNILGAKLTPEDHCGMAEKMLPLDELVTQYKEFPEIIRNTEHVLDVCNFEFDFDAPKNKKYYTGSRASDKALLADLARAGFTRRYNKNDKVALARVERELQVIDAMDFAAYFLITWDIIRYSTSRGFMHVGRGSGANSIVSYCLGITDICPIELNLYFERFLNPSRSSPPDFDIDWSWQDRDEILRYIFNRFDNKHVAFTGTIAEFKDRSIIREVGKVFGLPKEELDILADEPERAERKNAVVRQVLEYGSMLARTPNQRSMHSCGILISEQPLTDYTVLELPPKGFPIVQFDMHIAERIGFHKFDILSQRGIGHINDTVQIVEENRGVKIDIRDVRICKDEARANDLLRRGKTIGCYYVESPAMRGLLRKLRCDTYLVLVAASSIIRPGVAESGMMQEFVFRHTNPDKFEYFHPVFEEQLGDTYGVMVYQEDVLKIAHHFAGLDLADADILRRAMSGKSRAKKEFERVRKKFFDNCKAKGYPDALTGEVFRQIESFAGYSFCKAHSASYAVESYMSLYLKAYFPIEFMVGVINNFGGFYRTEVYVHEARMAGGIICQPCVNTSDHLTIIRGKEIYLGFIHIKSLKKIGELIPEERKKRGTFASLEDFINRMPVGIETLQILIYIGAFCFTGKPKNELILSARMLLSSFKSEKREQTLFREPAKEFVLPQLERSPFEDAFDEIEHLGFPVSCSPFDLLKTKNRGDVMTDELVDKEGEQVRMIGYLISKKHVPTKQGEMFFGTWIDAKGNYFDTAHFPFSLRRYPFQGGGCYLLSGKVQLEYGFPTVTIFKMAKLPMIPDPRYADDKDYSYKAHRNLKEDVSMTHRAPYPGENEIGLPRKKMQA